MIGKIITALLGVLATAVIAYAMTMSVPQLPQGTAANGTPRTAFKPEALNTFTFSTISGAATAQDLGFTACNHNLTVYISGSWQTTPLAPGNMVVVEGSPDNTNFVVISNYWQTTPASATGTQLTSQCYRYIRAGWNSAVNAYAWTTPSTGRLNVTVVSGGN